MELQKQYAYVGNEAQLYGVRRVILDEGNAKGIAIYQVTTAGGLELDILPDTGLDIGRVKFKGVNMNYMSKNGYDSPVRFLPVSGNFDRYFPGGMLFTCGLLSAGPENTDTDGNFHPLHGRYHGNSAFNLCASVEDGNIHVSGEVRETAQGKHNFSVRRKYTIPTWGSEILLEDEITNLTPSTVEFMMLYHMNFGYPMLSEKSEVLFPEKRKVTPRTKYAEEKLSEHCEISAPIDDEEECVYFHEMDDDAMVTLRNSELGIDAEVSWSLDTLPILAQWKNMKTGDYVLGLEPSNCYIMGLERERREGKLRVIAPFGKVKHFVRLKFSN